MLGTLYARAYVVWDLSILNLDSFISIFRVISTKGESGILL